MSSDGLEDLPLIDLFRAEAETHMEVLNAALLALEKSPEDTSRVSEMMRAAHSIKGAARVVGVDPAVSVAHAMEDCFVDAQNGVLTLSPAAVDILLRGVDLVGRISEATRDPGLELAVEFKSAVTSLVAELEAMRTQAGSPGGSLGPSATAPSKTQREAVESKSSASEVERVGPSAPTSATIEFPEILDAAVAELARKQFLAALERGCDLLSFDLRKTRDLDVQGLVFLAAVPLHVAGHNGPRVRLEGVSAELETVLRVTGLSESYAAAAGSSGPEHE